MLQLLLLDLALLGLLLPDLVKLLLSTPFLLHTFLMLGFLLAPEVFCLEGLDDGGLPLYLQGSLLSL